MTTIVDGDDGVKSVDGTASLPTFRGETSNSAGVFFPAADTVAISTASTERLRVGSTGGVGVGISPTGDSYVQIAAGSATVAPIKLHSSSGTVLTTATAGAIEYDGTCFYNTMATNNRGLMPSEQWVILTSNNTLTSQTAAQPIFDGGGAPPAGSITLPVGTYEFQCVFNLTGMSATSGSFGFSLGGTATFTQGWQALAAKGTAVSLATANPSTLSWHAAASTAIATAGVGTVGEAFIRGIIRITVTGTIIPQVSLGVAAAAVVQANSYCKFKALGSPTVVGIGNW